MLRTDGWLVRLSQSQTRSRRSTNRRPLTHRLVSDPGIDLAALPAFVPTALMVRSYKPLHSFRRRLSRSSVPPEARSDAHIDRVRLNVLPTATTPWARKTTGNQLWTPLHAQFLIRKSPTVLLTRLARSRQDAARRRCHRENQAAWIVVITTLATVSTNMTSDRRRR